MLICWRLPADLWTSLVKIWPRDVVLLASWMLICWRLRWCFVVVHGVFDIDLLTSSMKICWSRDLFCWKLVLLTSVLSSITFCCMFKLMSSEVICRCLWGHTNTWAHQRISTSHISACHHPPPPTKHNAEPHPARIHQHSHQCLNSISGNLASFHCVKQPSSTPSSTHSSTILNTFANTVSSTVFNALLNTFVNTVFPQHSHKPSSTHSSAQSPSSTAYSSTQ